MKLALLTKLTASASAIIVITWGIVYATGLFSALPSNPSWQTPGGSFSGRLANNIVGSCSVNEALKGFDANHNRICVPPMGIYSWPAIVSPSTLSGYPSAPPTGQYAGGKFWTAFKNLSGICPGNEVVKGFASDGWKYCAAPIDTQSYTAHTAPALSGMVWPTTPTGQSAGGKLQDFFANMFTICPGDKAVGGFNTDGTPICVDVKFVFNYAIATNTNNFDLRTAAVNAGWNGILLLDATVTVNPGVIVGSVSPSTAAFIAQWTLPVGSRLKIVNNGMVYGAGGNGGGGGCAFGTAGGSSNCITTGGNGGDAISMNIDTAIDNTNGNIYGGGGGGAGGVYCGGPNYAAWWWGGGGGQGVNGGGGGGGGGTDPSLAWIVYHAWSPWSAGSQFGPGGGGGGGTTGYAWRLDAFTPYISYSWYCWGQSGSSGGSWGMSSGGSAGSAVRKNGAAITWVGGNNSAQVKWSVN